MCFHCSETAVRGWPGKERFPHLLQGCVGDAEAAEAHVGEGLLQLPEQTGIRPMLEPFIGEQIGQLLSNRLDQLGFRDVVVDEAGDAVHIPWEEDGGNPTYEVRYCRSECSQNSRHQTTKDGESAYYAQKQNKTK